MSKSSMLLTVATLFLCTYTKAQKDKGDTLDIKRNGKGIIEFARFKPGDTRKLKDGAAFLKSILKAKADDDFKPTRETTDKLGINHRRFQQYYKNIKVDGAVLVLHGKNGYIESMNGHFQDVEAASYPSISEAQALKRALAFINAKKYNWEDASMEKFVKENTNNPDATYYPKGELLIAKDYLKEIKKHKLSWMFTISSMQPRQVQMIYVDAVTGEIISSRSLTESLLPPPSAETMYSGIAPIKDEYYGSRPLIKALIPPTHNAETMYSGTVQINDESYGGGYRLRGTTSPNSVIVHTKNIQHYTYTGFAIEFTNSNPNWITGDWSAISTDQPALDAHWGAEKILHCWDTYYSRNSIDGSGLSLINYAHYGTGDDAENAFWQGGTGNHYALYGDGDGSSMRPLVSLDICAHEFGHGLDEFTVDILQGAYPFDEAYALSEGLSDIWGAAIEYKESPNQIWKIGEQVFASTYTCVRDMQNPKSTSTLLGQCPNTYQGDYWDIYTPHKNSTVLSHWFYLLSAGGSGTNDNDDPYNISGMGIDDAADIVYKAQNDNYLTSGDDFSNARTATIQAAIDIYGLGSCEEAMVTNAWYAVGLGDPYSSISGSSTLCSGTSGSYSINNLPTGATVVWSASPYGTVTINSPTSTTTTLTKSGGGYITLMATITSSCGTMVVYSDPILIGYPAAADIVGMDPTEYFFAGQPVYLSVDESVSGYSWTVYGGTIVGSSTSKNITVMLDNCYPNQTQNNDFDANVVLTNEGCESANYHEHTYATCMGGRPGFTISPNPAVDGYIHLSIGSVKKSSEQKISSRVVIKLYDIITNKMVRQWSFAVGQSKYDLKTDGLPKGHYIIEVSRGSDKQGKHILIE